MGIAEQVSTTEVELYKTTEELIKAHKRNRKLADSLTHAKQEIASLTRENQNLRNLLKKNGIDVPDKL